MDYKKAFYSKLEDCYLGVRIVEGLVDNVAKSGFANLLSIKRQYFKHIKAYLDNATEEEAGRLAAIQIDAKALSQRGTQDFASSQEIPQKQELPTLLIESEKADIYNKLYTFFDSYLSESGTPFFNDTPIYKNIYAKVYSNSKDTSLFYKTQNLYYVKSDTLYVSMNIIDERGKILFQFDASEYSQNSDNAKNKVFFRLVSIKSLAQSNAESKQVELQNLTSNLSQEHTQNPPRDSVQQDLQESLEGIDTSKLESIITIKVLNSKDTLIDSTNIFKQNSNEFNDEFVKALKNANIKIHEDELKKIFRSYKKQNEIDFFIHKNAREFLQEQFDLWMFSYIYKDSKTDFSPQTLKRLQAIRKIALKVIELIGDFEDELKAIWLKPKFAKNTQYVLSLDKILEYSKDSKQVLESITNDKGFESQIKEWQELKLIDEGFKKEDLLELYSCYGIDPSPTPPARGGAKEISNSLSLEGEAKESLESPSQYKDSLDSHSQCGDSLTSSYPLSGEAKDTPNSLSHCGDFSISSPSHCGGSFVSSPSLSGGGKGVGETSNNENKGIQTYINAHRYLAPYMKEFSREMRKNPTEAEKKLWQELRNKKLGFGFRRQFVIDSKYIADFVCLEKRLIIECDGGQHSESFEDKERDFYLESQNFRILRFWNNEILGNMEGVLEWIKEALENPTHPLTPSAKGGGIIEIPTQKKEGMSEEASAKEEGIDKQSFTNNKELGSLDQSSHSPCGRGWGGENIVEQYRYLPIDTKHFSKETRYKILSSFEDLESLLNGELIKSDNFQALNSIMPKYKGKIDLIYIDPPYNAPASEIIYKNNFKDSTWLSMMENRLSLAKEFLSKRGILSCAIDENEQENLGLLLGDIFYDYKKTCVSVVHNHGGIQGDNFSYSHEYAYFLYPIIKDLLNREKREDANIVALRDWGNGGSERHTAKNCFYPIYVKDSQIVGFGEVCKDDFHPPANVMREDGVIEVYPIDDEGVERKWRNAKNTIESIQDKLICKCIKGIFSIHRIKDEFRFKTCWYDKKYNANSYGSNILTNILPNNEFDYPKSIHTVKDSIYLASKEDSIVMDFFGGSGTTAHAVLELNKESGNRKFVLVEQGEHFYNVIIPRIKKVAFSSEWKNGELKDNKQVNPCSIAFAYYELESYEEALENCEYVLSENLPSSFAEREGESPRHCEQSEAIQKQSQIQNMDCHEVVPTSRNDKAKIIDYRKSRKLIKELDKGETINLDMSGEYRKKFDIFQTLANLMGWKIKRLFLDSKGVESCEYDNGEIVSIDKLDLQKYPRLKNLIWWE